MIPAPSHAASVSFRQVTNQIKRKRKRKISTLVPEVQDSAALLAVDDFLSRFNARCGRSRYFHVAAGTNTVLHGDDCSVAFTVEQALELVEQIGVDFRRKRFPLSFEFLLLRSQRF